MNIYDVAELQQYLNPQANQQSTQLVDPTMLLRQRSPLLGIQSQRLVDPITLIPQIPGGITASSAIPFGSPVDIAQGFTRNTPSDQGTNFQFLESANENEIDEVMDTRSGIAKLFEFLQRFSPVANIARGIESIRNRFDTRKAIQRDIQRDTQGTINNIVSPRIMNMQPTAQDRGRGSIPSRSSPTTSKRDTSPSSSYSQASYARRR
jgi:hypothetical protein